MDSKAPQDGFDRVLDTFEQQVFNGKRKLNTNERFYFRAGLHSLWTLSQQVVDWTPQQGLNFANDMLKADHAFATGDLAQMHRAYCDGCDKHLSEMEKKK